MPKYHLTPTESFYALNLKNGKESKRKVINVWILAEYLMAIWEGKFSVKEKPCPCNHLNNSFFI